MPLTETQILDADKIMATYFPELVKLFVGFYRERVKQLLPDYGTHLVQDATYYASLARADGGAWLRDGWIEDKARRQQVQAAMPRNRLAEMAGIGYCHYGFKWRLWTNRPKATNDSTFNDGRDIDDEDGEAEDGWDDPDEPGAEPAGKRKKRSAGLFGRKLHLTIDGPSGLPVVAILAPADVSEKSVFLNDTLPELDLLMKQGLIKPRTLVADAGYSGNKISRALLQRKIAPRIDLVNRRGQHKDVRIQQAGVQTFLLVRGHVGRRLGMFRRTQDRYGNDLKKPVLEPVYQLLPIVRVDADRLRIAFGCCPQPAKQVAMLLDEDRVRLGNRWACGAEHTDADPCRAGRDGVLYWVKVTGKLLDTTVITRPEPAAGTGWWPNEVHTVEVGPRVSERTWEHEYATRVRLAGTARR